MFLPTKLDEAPIFIGEKRRFIEFGSEEQRRKMGRRTELSPEYLVAVADIYATFVRFGDTTAGKVVDGISLVVEQDIAIQERQVRCILFWGKDEAYALGERLAQRVVLIGC